MYEFCVIGGEVVRDVVVRRREEIVREVERTYLAHDDGESVNPDSYFLRFPEKPDSRIIALPAYLGGLGVAGIKWIGSFPANIARGVPRASAVLVLNDYETGHPFAVIEASQISAARTAASAVLAAEVLTGARRARRLAVVGAGVIARNVFEFFAARQWVFDSAVAYDRIADYRDALVRYAGSALGYRVTGASDLTSTLDGADLVLFATTAAEPYVTDPDAFAPGTVVLNISLRDLSPQIIVGAYNVLDDVEHCLKANTSPHLAEQQYGHRGFITGTLAQVIRGTARTGTDKPIVFSPFGLGVLDLSVGMLVYREAVESGGALDIPGFFGERRRW
jgi:N-[(2S)-2-amino-2-carboxyethyl]-L-glutamate dehydrogenase